MGSIVGVSTIEAATEKLGVTVPESVELRYRTVVATGSSFVGR